MTSASQSRRRALVVAVVGAVALGGVAIATSGGEEADGLRVERSQTEVVVYLADAGANEPGRAGGERSVTLECLDAEGEVLARAPMAWPFADTDGGKLEPHAHLPIDPVTIQQVDRCRLRGTDPVLEGGVL
ncbi:MAG: hypothetical protein JW895_12705 [Thermoleophilaceae bacterium]|nr:hypothetical protein [Thermoleophilaceae bacterium]